MRIDVSGILHQKSVLVDGGFGWRGYIFSADPGKDILVKAREVCGRKGVVMSGQYVFKIFEFPLLERLLGCELDACRGLTGGQGELVNSLAANGRSVASPLMCAAVLDFLRGRIVLVMERLSSCRTLEDILHESTCDHAGLFFRVFSVLLKALECGIYHADPNSSNILFSSGGEGYLIDFECSLPLGCDFPRALALQVSSLWDWRMRDVVSRDEIRAWLLSFMQTRFCVSGVSDAIALFDVYTLNRPGRTLRSERLAMASAGKPDIRCLLGG